MNGTRPTIGNVPFANRLERLGEQRSPVADYISSISARTRTPGELEMNNAVGRAADALRECVLRDGRSRPRHEHDCEDDRESNDE